LRADTGRSPAWVAAILVLPGILLAQPQTSAAGQAALPKPPPAVTVEPSGQTATLTYFNRTIVVLRARVVGRPPAERVEGAERILDDLVEAHVAGPVDLQSYDGGVLINVGQRAVFAVTTVDVDVLAGDTLQDTAEHAASNLRLALREAVDARTPWVLLIASGAALAALALAIALVWAIWRTEQLLGAQLDRISEWAVSGSGRAEIQILRASRVIDFGRRLLIAIAVVLQLVVVYATTAFILRRFPFTRPWGESMNGFMLRTLESMALGIVDAVPGLFTAAVMFLIARFLTHLVGIWFKGVEEGRVRARWIHPETAQPTRRLLTGAIWIFALVLAYPNLPGSQSDAFKGVSVFLGLMLTLGSSGLVNQVMSGFMLTYSRALRLGDYVRIGEVEGTVTHVGVLSTKIRTPWTEEVTVPNAVVVGQTTTDYSRLAESGVLTPTVVTIGYDAPWRQVQALLLSAAARTPGLKKQPEPMVLQSALQDYYVKYTLLVALERQELRVFTLHDLHANIQDLFNEYGVQIMSPNYVVDPKTPKVVARKDWFAAPASTDPSWAATTTGATGGSSPARTRPDPGSD
jgi:small-conductance mechanosensitive channel